MKSFKQWVESNWEELVGNKLTKAMLENLEYVVVEGFGWKKEHEVFRTKNRLEAEEFAKRHEEKQLEELRMNHPEMVKFYWVKVRVALQSK